MTKELALIIGSGPFAAELGCYLSDTYIDICYLIKENERIDDSVFTIKKSNVFVFCDILKLLNELECNFNIYLGAGNPSIKTKMLEELDYYLKDKRFNFGKPLILGKNFNNRIENGSIVAPNSCIAPFSALSNNVLINYNATVGHHTIIGRNSTVSPNASIGGKCIIGESVFIGSGASIKERLHIGSESIVGMGAVVTNHVPPRSVVVGNPAKVFSKEDWPSVSKTLSKINKKEVEKICQI